MFKLRYGILQTLPIIVRVVMYAMVGNKSVSFIACEIINYYMMHSDTVELHSK